MYQVTSFFKEKVTNGEAILYNTTITLSIFIFTCVKNRRNPNHSRVWLVLLLSSLQLIEFSLVTEQCRVAYKYV